MAGTLFEDILKFNPYHDAKGRFSTSGNFASFTYSPGKSRAHDLAIQREKDRVAGRMPTDAQAKTLKGIESRTRNLKKEQYRVVDREGNVVMQKQGNKNSVSYSVGEARDNIPGNITIHNHPDGGTFSSADLSDIGYGATEIRAAAPEGTYVLRNARYGTRYDPAKVKTWYDMRNDIDAASGGFKTHRHLKSEIRKPFDEQLKPLSDQWASRKAAGADWDELNKLAAEYTAKAESFRPQIEAAARKAYVEQYHHWYQANAGTYGLEYEFIPVQSKARKSVMDDIIDTIVKSEGDVVLDRKMQEDIEEITNDIMKDLLAGIPTIQKSADTNENTVTIYKTDEDKRLVFGWASISYTVDGEQLEDRQQDMIDPEDLEEAVYEYVLNFRDTGEEHIPTMRKKGKLVESCVLTEEKQRAMGIPPGTLPIGWWIGFKIEDDDAWERVKNGTYRMFSIEGKANREPVEKSLEEEREEKVAKTFNDVLGIQPTARVIGKNHPDRFDHIEEVVGKSERFDHLEEIEKFNPYHDSRGRFASANSFSSFSATPGKSRAHDMAIQRENERNRVMGPGGKMRDYGEGDTRDALDEINSGKHNSLEQYLDADGNLSPDRAAVHRQIINDILEGKVPVEGQAKMTMLGGGPASGKSSVMNPDTSGDPHSVTIDPDGIKKMLPGYDKMSRETDKAAAFYHEESSMIAKQLASVVYGENYNAIYDGTGDGSENSVMKKVNGARAAGYSVEAKYVSVDTDTALQRSHKRYEDAKANGEMPRQVPDSVITGTHAKCTDISVSCAKEFDSIEIWDNNGGRGQQKLIATGGSGKGLTAVSGQEAAFDRYLAKGSNGVEGFITLPDGQVIPAE